MINKLKRKLYNLLEYSSGEVKRMRLQNRGVTLHGRVFLENGIHINLGAHFWPEPKGKFVINDNCRISRGFICDCFGGIVSIGKNSFIGPACIFYGHGNISIGDNCQIAMGCRIVSSNHDISSTIIPINAAPNIKLPVVIEEDVWLGANVIVLGGVTIGKGAVVGAGSIVTKDIEPYTVNVGNPARRIKFRH